MGVFLDVLLQERKHDVFAESGADTDMEVSYFQFLISFELKFSFFDGGKCRSDMLVQKFSFFGQGNSSGFSEKQGGIKLPFQIFNGLTHRGLAHKQFFGCTGDISGFCGCVKDVIVG